MNKRLGLACIVLLGCGEEVPLGSGEFGPREGAFITGNVTLPADCTPTPDAPPLQRGQYDVATSPDGGGSPESCRQAYVLRLAVEIDDKETVLFDQASIQIATPNDETLAFGDDSMPNPFSVTLAGSVRSGGDTPRRGVIEVAAIPAGYGESLVDFADSEVIVQVQLNGQTRDGTIVRSQRFRYPVAICVGCLSACFLQDIDFDPTTTLEDFTDGKCDDNAGADGRFCIDDDC